MIVVAWPSGTAKKAEVWRVLDLCGLTSSVRQSRNYTKAGYTFLNGNRVDSLKATVPIGALFTLELKFPSGKVKYREVFLTNKLPRHSARQSGPHIRNYRG